MPSLKSYATFEVEFIWLFAPSSNDTDLTVYMRVIIHSAAWGMSSILKNESISNSIKVYSKLRQKLLERFPRQEQAAGPGGRDGATQNDIDAVLELGKTASARMPAGAMFSCAHAACGAGAWQDCLCARMPAGAPFSLAHAACL